MVFYGNNNSNNKRNANLKPCVVAVVCKCDCSSCFIMVNMAYCCYCLFVFCCFFFFFVLCIFGLFSALTLMLRGCGNNIWAAHRAWKNSKWATKRSKSHRVESRFDCNVFVDDGCVEVKKLSCCSLLNAACMTTTNHMYNNIHTHTHTDA